jgi:hypothetical protein
VSGGRAAITALLLAVPLAATAGPIAELRVYPTGELYSLGWAWSQGEALHAGIAGGYNRADRGDAGEHDDEEGGGLGAGVWAEVQPRFLPAAFTLGGRLELYQLDLDWREGARRGESAVTVLIPTAMLGYRLPFGGANWVWTLSASAGAEINLATEGEAVGEGAIGLAGLRVHWR